MVTDPTIALFLYDYLLTLFEEVDLVWKGKFGLASTLYLMTKYLVILGIVYNVAGDPSQPLVSFFNYLAWIGQLISY